MSKPIEIVGAPGSPYSRKMRAVLRYRRIPYIWHQRGWPSAESIPPARVPVIPFLRFPGEQTSVADSTPLIRRLERDYDGRSVIPDDPVIAFLDALLEDYGDEWLTKCMFHYRWAFQADIDKAASILPRWARVNATDAEVAPFSKQFSERQIARLFVVGSNETTGPVIEESYRRFLEVFDARLTEAPFALGERPGSCDFALYGQLTQLALFDPTPAAITVEQAPRVYAWVESTEELSGWEPSQSGWVDRDAIPATLKAMLGEVGRVYAPALIANAAALSANADQVECEIAGKPWVQKPFPYQGKCLQAIREGYAALSTGDRSALDGILAGTGCEVLVAG